MRVDRVPIPLDEDPTPKPTKKAKADLENLAEKAFVCIHIYMRICI